MKKLLTVLIASLMMFTLVGCSSSKKIDKINVKELPTMIRYTADGGYLCDENGNEICFEVSDDDLKKYYAYENGFTITYDGELWFEVLLKPNEGYEFKEGFTISDDRVESTLFSSADETVNIPVTDEDYEWVLSYTDAVELGDALIEWKVGSYNEPITSVNLKTIPSLYVADGDYMTFADEEGNRVYVEIADEDIDKYTLAASGEFTSTEDEEFGYVLLRANDKYVFVNGYTVPDGTIAENCSDEDENINTPILTDADLTAAKTICDDAQLNDVIIYWPITEVTK